MAARPDDSSDSDRHRDEHAEVIPLRGSRPADTVTPAPTADDGSPTSVDPRWAEVLGDVLRAERRRQGRTLADVADRAAVSLPYLSEVERGRKEISSDLLAAVITSLDVDLASVLERAAEHLRATHIAPVRVGSRGAQSGGVGSAQLLAA